MRLRTLHKRRKRKLFGKPRKELQFNNIVIPSGSFRSFDININNNLDLGEKSEDGYFRSSLRNSTGLNLIFKGSIKMFNSFGFRTWTEENEDGTFSHSMFLETADYKTLDKENFD